MCDFMYVAHSYYSNMCDFIMRTWTETTVAKILLPSKYISSVKIMKGLDLSLGNIDFCSSTIYRQTLL